MQKDEWLNLQTRNMPLGHQSARCANAPLGASRANFDAYCHSAAAAVTHTHAPDSSAFLRSYGWQACNSALGSPAVGVGECSQAVQLLSCLVFWFPSCNRSSQMGH